MFEIQTTVSPGEHYFFCYLDAVESPGTKKISPQKPQGPSKALKIIDAAAQGVSHSQNYL